MRTILRQKLSAGLESTKRVITGYSLPTLSFIILGSGNISFSSIGFSGIRQIINENDITAEIISSEYKDDDAYDTVTFIKMQNIKNNEDLKKHILFFDSFVSLENCILHFYLL